MAVEPRPFKHVRKRLWQRYRIRIWPAEYAALCRGLGSGRYPSQLVDGHPNGPRVLIQFTYARRPVLAVWDQEDGLLITALPLGSRSRVRLARD
ncbi:hypothetical protein HLB42_21610 (plasmid) [Deinococcus sp. D7000]|nr:hypothetical protein HLB42_13885 [Deinococcus sp. D7000]QLG13539.1 hypothetical protein HLB42_21610 [Deinococcus sp. D7000]